nr:uncharacterized protein LOC123751662 [Procambarus clarkii]
MAMTCKILFVLTLATVNGQMLEHRDLVAMNASCSVEGFCDGSDYKSRENCYCDDLCAEYGDCCPDSFHYRREDQVRPEKYGCVSVGYRSVYMKDTCMSGWQDEEVAQLCLAGSPANISSSRDPLAHLPATSNTTSVTYTNYYCAICNNDSHDLTLWKTELQFDLSMKHPSDQQNNLTEYITSHLLFANGTWGAFIPLNNTDIFKTININIVIPSITRDCDSTIRSCAENWKDASVAALCHSYTAVRYVGFIAYRNPHCLLCNNHQFSKSSCQTYSYSIVAHGFIIVVDMNDSSGSNIVGFTNTCQSDESHDIFLKTCRNTRKNVNQTYTGDKCIDDDVEGTTNSSDASTCSSYTTGSNRTTCEFKETLKCEKKCLIKGKFTLYENRTVYIEPYDRWYHAGGYEITNGGVLVCSTQTQTEKFSAVMGWVSLAGLGLSCLCLLLHLAAFLLVPRLRNLPGKSLASLCLSLLTAYTIFIFSTFIKPRTTGCYISGVIMYYSFLASFCWMNIMAFDVWLTFRQAKDELRVSSGRQRSKFLFYCVYGWLLPALAVAVTVTLDKIAPAGLPSEFLPNFGQSLCWFGQRKALIVFFAAPLFVIMAVNVVFFLFTSYTIGASREPTLRSSCPQNKKQFLLYVRLAVLMGLSWITGIVAGYLQLEAVWYVFVVLNTLQGVFIFLTFTCRSKVWLAVQELCFKEAKSHSGTSMTPPRPGLTSDIIDSSRISIDTELSSM